MSYRELRNFAETMRILGYPQVISIDSFRVPNFGLVADCLYWLVKRLDQSSNISENIETEEDRVEFVIGIADALVSKASITLNPKKIYCADGRAVQEMLKVASFLRKALLSVQSKCFEEDQDFHLSQTLNEQLPKIKEARRLVSEIVQSGSKLYELLGNESNAARARNQALEFLEAATSDSAPTQERLMIEEKLKELTEREKKNVEVLCETTKQLEVEEKELDDEIQKAKGEIERYEKRLKSLKTHKPAYAEELEQLEEQLQQCYEEYVTRFRNLNYLEHELRQFDEREKEDVAEHQRRRTRNANKARKEQLKQFINRDSVSDAAIEMEVQRARHSSQALDNLLYKDRDDTFRSSVKLSDESAERLSIISTEEEISLVGSRSGSDFSPSEENDTSYNGNSSNYSGEISYENF